MKDISFDLETLGLGAEAMIVSIGAVKFDRNTGHIEDEFYRVIDIEDPLGGGTIDASTVAWWMRQPEEVREAVFGESAAEYRQPLRVALAEFSEFIGYNEDLAEGEYPDITLWQRGDKDSQWLTSAYSGMQLAVPYRYWQVKDQRTLCDLFQPFLPVRLCEDLPLHHALDDAYYQADCLIHVFARLHATGALAAGPAPDIRKAEVPLAAAAPYSPETVVGGDDPYQHFADRFAQDQGSSLMSSAQCNSNFSGDSSPSE